MQARCWKVSVWVVAGALALAGGLAAHAGGPPVTQITIWAAAGSGAFGGQGYGTSVPTGALVSEHHELVVASDGSARLVGVPATIDPASVQLRDLTDPDAAVLEQRFLSAPSSPGELLGRHVGEPVAITTAKGELAGVLRATDDQNVVIEVGSGDARHLQVLRRDGFVQSIRLAGEPPAGADRPSLSWRLRTARPGKHDVVVDYRAGGMTWDVSYLAVLDEAAKAVDFTARALIHNATGGSFDNAELTLVSGAPALGLAGAPVAIVPPTPFVVATPIHIAPNDAVQVELLGHHAPVPVKPVITFEAIANQASAFQAAPGSDCAQLNGSDPSTGRAELAIEMAAPSKAVLPDGKVRLYRRRAGGVELISEEPLRTGAGVARIRVAAAGDIAGERHATTCNFDEHARTLQEVIELKLTNKGKQAVDVVVREFMWRWPAWKLEAEDHKGVRAGPQTQEYRVQVPAGGEQHVSYTVDYAW
jgi:hypothetical protein